MSEGKLLRMTLTPLAGPCREIEFPARSLVACGWVGRDRGALQAHIQELAALGIPAPGRVPIYMTLRPSILTTRGEVEVISENSSGEVEYVLLFMDNEILVTVGSDHTDREVETKSIPASKLMYPKFLAEECWQWTDLQGHWDDLVLRCWVDKDGRRTLYQEGSLGTMLTPRELLGQMPNGMHTPGDNLVLYSGTIPTRGGVIYGDAYDLELADPVLRRSIRARYAVRMLPQYL